MWDSEFRPRNKTTKNIRKEVKKIIPKTIKMDLKASWKTTIRCVMLETRLSPSPSFPPLEGRQQGWRVGSVVGSWMHTCGSSHQSLTPVLEYGVTSSDLHLHQARTYYKHMYVGKQVIHINLKALFLLNERERKAATPCQTVENTAHGSQTVPPPGTSPHWSHIQKERWADGTFRCLPKTLLQLRRTALPPAPL